MGLSLQDILLKLAETPTYMESVKDDVKSGVISGAVKGGIVAPALSMMAMGHPLTAIAAIPAGIIGGGLLSGGLSGAGSAVSSMSKDVRKSSDARRGAISGAIGGAIGGAALPYAEKLHPSIKKQYASALRYANRVGAGKYIPKSIHGRSAALAAISALIGGGMGAIGGHLHEKSRG